MQVAARRTRAASSAVIKCGWARCAGWLVAGLIVVLPCLAFGAAPAAPGVAPAAASTAPAPTATATAPAPAANPAPPAFCIDGVRRATNIGADSFDLRRDDGKIVKVRLRDADCQAMTKSEQDKAAFVIKGLLDNNSLWVFPCGQAKGEGADELWADIWTAKGWMSELLIRAGYAERRADLAGVTLTPPDVGPSVKGPPPPAPAYAATSVTAVDGDTYEVTQGGRKSTVRLIGIEVESDKRDAAKTAAAGPLAAGPVWVFPCRAALPGSAEPAQVRLWTAAGSLSELLVSAQAAKRASEAPAAKPVVAAAAPAPRRIELPKKAPPQITWTPVTISGMTGGVGSVAGAVATMVGVGGAGITKTEPFKISSPVWRITWNCKPSNVNVPVTISIFRNDEGTAASTSVMSMGGNSGVQVLQTRPGNFWFSLAGSADVPGVKVEEASQ